MPTKVYTTLMVLGFNLLPSVSDTDNPFKNSTPIHLIFLLTALSSHALASLAEETTFTTTLIFHVSGLLACETLLCIILAPFPWWCYYLINFLLLLLTPLCFKDQITHFLRGTPHHNIPDLESQSQSHSGSKRTSMLFLHPLKCQLGFLPFLQLRAPSNLHYQSSLWRCRSSSVPKILTHKIYCYLV